MDEFRENLQTEGRTDGPYFIGPFWPRLWVQKVLNMLLFLALPDCHLYLQTLTLK